MLAMSPIAVDCTSRFLPHNAAVSARSIALNPNARTDAHMDAGEKRDPSGADNKQAEADDK